jgi:hypothetical protein
MKTDHEQRTSLLSVEQVENVSEEIKLLIDQSVTALNQSGGITAHTVNIHVNASPVQPQTAPAKWPPPFPRVEAEDRQARFRPKDQPLGVYWSTIPLADAPDREIFLSKGPAMWLRVMPKTAIEKEWSAEELLTCATADGVSTLKPFVLGNLNYLRAEDGFGAYSFVNPLDSETRSVAFAFDTGEVWSVDTYLLAKSRNLQFYEIAGIFKRSLHVYGEFLKNLGLKPPFDWIAGLEDVKGRSLRVPRPPNEVGLFIGSSCMSDVVTAYGSYDRRLSSSAEALMPFFNQIFRKCSMQFPDYLYEFMRISR